MKKLGEIIRERRKELNLKVYELANKVGVNPVYITQVEKNIKLPSVDKFSSISEILNLSHDVISSYYKQKITKKVSKDSRPAFEIVVMRNIRALYHNEYKAAALTILRYSAPSFAPSKSEIDKIVSALKKQRKILNDFNLEVRKSEKDLDKCVDSILRKNGFEPPKRLPLK